MKYKISAWIVGIIALGWLATSFSMGNDPEYTGAQSYFRVMGFGAVCVTGYLIYKSKTYKKDEEENFKKETKYFVNEEKMQTEEKKPNYEITYWPGTKIPCIEIYRKNGENHRIGDPALTLYYANSLIIKHVEVYYIEGKKHRENGPAEIYYDENGKITAEYYYINDQLHRTDGPAKINYGDNDKIKDETYYQNNKIHREDGPAKIIYYLNGNVKEELYYQNDKLYRVNGPVAIYYDKNGNIE